MPITRSKGAPENEEERRPHENHALFGFPCIPACRFSDAMATATQWGLTKELDTKKRSSTSSHFEDALRKRIAGQDEAVQALVELYQTFCVGLNSPARPVGNLLFLGPTGSGKTRIVEAAAEILFGDSRALIKVDCGEFQHSHEIAKLIGSPPRYLGHRETHPLITQEALTASHPQ